MSKQAFTAWPLHRALAAIVLLVAAVAAASYLLGPTAARSAEQRSSASAVENPHGDLKTECEACHTAKSWKVLRKPLAFDHASTGFPLVGRHRNASCRDCHASLEFARVAASCADCHADVHKGARGANCQDCHTPQRWSNRSQALTEHARTGFPLRGGHALAECTRCHVGSGEQTQAKISSDCISCHTADYAATTSPNHQSAGFSTRCEQCHDPSRTTWAGVGFNHALTGFPLTGAHRLAACQSCHAGGRYQGTPTDCYACHQADYTGTQNPNHSASGFSTQCVSCHTTTGWVPASFDHDGLFFRIYSGRHQGTWSSCTQCHPTASNYANFTCLTCHTQSNTNSQHQGVNGYSYDSQACYNCHRRV